MGYNLFYPLLKETTLYGYLTETDSYKRSLNSLKKKIDGILVKLSQKKKVDENFLDNLKLLSYYNGKIKGELWNLRKTYPILLGKKINNSVVALLNKGNVEFYKEKVPPDGYENVNEINLIPLSRNDLAGINEKEVRKKNLPFY